MKRMIAFLPVAVAAVVGVHALEFPELRRASMGGALENAIFIMRTLRVSTGGFA